jgi:hypothetical protein
VGSTPIRGAKHLAALIAQLVERWPEEPEVAGSIPAQCTTFFLASSKAALRLAVNQEIVGSNPTSPATIEAKSLRAGSHWPGPARVSDPLLGHMGAQRMRAWAADDFRRDGRGAQGIGLLNRRGANRRAWVRIPLSPPRSCTHSSEAERRSYKAEVLGSIPSACTNQRDVSSAGTERRFAMPEAEGSSPSRRTTCS